jgi:hypothetical protein
MSKELSIKIEIKYKKLLTTRPAHNIAYNTWRCTMIIKGNRHLLYAGR